MRISCVCYVRRRSDSGVGGSSENSTTFHRDRTGRVSNPRSAMTIRILSKAGTAAILITITSLMFTVQIASGITAKEDSYPLQSGSTSCPSVWFVGAQGSGQTYVSSQHGMGPEVSYMGSVVEDTLQKYGVSFGWQPINNYTAASVSVLYPSSLEVDALEVSAEGLSIGQPLAASLASPAIANYIARHVRPYEQSIQSGIVGAEQAVNTIVAKCPNSQIVMAGYSQGAIAIHDAEYSLSRTSPSEYTHVAATLLLGDGDRVPSTRAMLFGSAPRSSSGIRVYLHLVTPHDVASPSTTAEIANAGDVVADFSLRKDDSRGKWQTSISTHEAYVTDLTKSSLSCSVNILGCAAAWAASVVLPKVQQSENLGSPTIAGASEFPLGTTISGNTLTDQAIQENSSQGDATPYFWQSAEYWLLDVTTDSPTTLTYNVNTTTGGPILQLMAPGTTDSSAGDANGIDFDGIASGFNIGQPGNYEFNLPPGIYVVAIGNGNVNGKSGTYSFSFSTGTSPSTTMASASASTEPGSAVDIDSGVTLEGNIMTDPAAIASQGEQSSPQGWSSGEYWLVNVSQGVPLELGYSISAGSGGPSFGIFSFSSLTTQGGGSTRANQQLFLNTDGTEDGTYFTDQGWYSFSLPTGTYVIVVGSSSDSGSDGDFAMTVSS